MSNIRSLLVCCLLAVAMLVTPSAVFAQHLTTAPKPTVSQGSITEILSQETITYPDGTQTLLQTLEVQLQSGEVVETQVERLSTDDTFTYSTGDKVVINTEIGPDQTTLHYIADHVRVDAIWAVLLLFVVIVLAVARWHGVRSLIGLISSFVIIFSVVLPYIERGYDPLVVAIGGAVLSMLITFYLSHGFNHKTTVAVQGTFASLVATGLLAVLFTTLAKLTGFAAEEAAFLQTLKGDSFNARGVMLAGIIIGSLGILDDITISQASIVQELRAANAKLKPQQLFTQAMNVGRDHIGSLVNTLVLVYTGSALPLLLLFRDAQISPLLLLNYEIIAEEIIRMMVGSIGLVLAVPITTALAVWQKSGKTDSSSHSKHHHTH